MRGGRAALVRVAGVDQRCAHVETVQEATATRVVGRADGVIRTSVQATQSQPETFSGAYPGGGHRGIIARTVLRDRGRDGVRRTAVHST